jgi:CBS domain containing-hemolysin-like protein
MESGVSRVPLYRDDLDQVEGFVHAKDVLALLARGERQRPVSEVARPIHFVPESKPLAELLAEMRQGGFHLAMVSDEYGSLVGLVTLEDVIEEVVGQIADEFDREPPEIERLADGRLRVQASVPIVDLNELLGIELPHASWNTVGGLVFGLAGRIPEPGASVELEGVRFTVERVQGRRIVTVLVRPPSSDRS